MQEEQQQSKKLRTKIKRSSGRLALVGVGGGGDHVVDFAIRRYVASEYPHLSIAAINTDLAELDKLFQKEAVKDSAVAEEWIDSDNFRKIEIGTGLGAGGEVMAGNSAATEALPEIEEFLQGIDQMIMFGGASGGTGPSMAVIARAAVKLGITTIGILAMPLRFEGSGRKKKAAIARAELEAAGGSNIIIFNGNHPDGEALVSTVWRDVNLGCLHPLLNVLTFLFLKVSNVINRDPNDSKVTFSAGPYAYFGYCEIDRKNKEKGVKKDIPAIVEALVNNIYQDPRIINKAVRILPQFYGAWSNSDAEGVMDGVVQKVDPKFREDLQISPGIAESDNEEENEWVSIIVVAAEPPDAGVQVGAGQKQIGASPEPEPAAPLKGLPLSQRTATITPRINNTEVPTRVTPATAKEYNAFFGKNLRAREKSQQFGVLMQRIFEETEIMIDSLMFRDDD